MNHLAPYGEGAYKLPAHAHVIVYDGNDRELVTIYDCGAAQKPPSAQLLGTLGRIEAAHDLTHTETGYVVSMREAAVLEEDSEGHYRIAPVAEDDGSASMID